MEKLDLTKLYKKYYTSKSQPELIELEEANYISLQGKGDPSGPAFAESIQCLYSTAYTLKFIYKEINQDYVVPKLEGQWWFDEDKFGKYTMEEAPVKIPRSEWNYRLLLRLPEFVSKEDVELAKAATLRKKSMPGIELVKFFQLPKSKVAQILHVGPFDKEPESLLLLADFMLHMSLKRNGVHHEVYLSDFRKTVPEKLKTILREPVK